jgi:radical SAM superfamily enzyme YgiQ (UPF0313 family)
MKILLLRPNSQLTVTPVPVGLGYIAHSLVEKRGDDVRIIDGRMMRAPHKELASLAREYGPDIIGVTAMTYESSDASELVSLLKKTMPDVPVVMGGPHVTGYGPDFLEKCECDYLVLGEGEETMIELASAIENKSGSKNIKGIAYREDDEIRSTEKRSPISDMDKLAVEWDLLNPDDYFVWWRRNAMNTIAKSNRRLPVFFSRGCPMGCSYCHHIFGREYRTFPVDETVQMMLELKAKYNLGEFEIIDDNFNLKLDHAKEVMEKIIQSKLGCALTFTNGLRADKMDDELLELMKKAGTYRIDYAIESASARIQKLVHKNLDLDRAREVVNMTAQKGIVTGAYYMLGFPGETKDEMEETVEYALSLTNHISSFFYLMPFPGTEIAESDPDISKKVKNISFGDASGIVMNLSGTSCEDMMKIRKSAYRKFFFSPARIMKIAKDVPKNTRTLASAFAVARLSLQEKVDY